MNLSELKQMQSLPLEAKILKTMQRIQEWYEYFNGEVYVSFSGGKDSTVLLDIVRSKYPDVLAVYIDNGLEYSDIKNFVKTIPNCKLIRPRLKFDEVIKKYGYPIISKEQSQFIYEYKNTKSQKLKEIRINGNKWDKGKIAKKWLYLLDSDVKISHLCCNKLKKDPVKLFEKETGLKPYLGNLATESRLRTSAYIKYGCNAFTASRPISKPLAFWVENDILEYLYTKKIPYSPIYGEIIEKDGVYSNTGVDRTGCIFCGFGCHMEKEPNRFQVLKTTHFKQWNYCIHLLGMKDALDLINVKYE